MGEAGRGGKASQPARGPRAPVRRPDAGQTAPHMRVGLPVAPRPVITGAMIDKLEMFIALAREEHFGRAAESLGIAQPTLSSGLKQLEAQLGVQLVWRGARFAGLTPEGQRVLVWARQIVGDTHTMREEMRSLRAGLSGDLRLAAIPTALSAVAALTARFAADNPNVRLTVLSRPSTAILSMIENLQADAGVTYLDNEPLGRMTALPLYRERFCFVCPGSNPLADRAELGWAEIADQPLCLLTPDMQNRRIVNQAFLEVDRSVTPAIESNSTVVLMAHVAAGPWATVLPARMARFLGAGKGVRIIPLSAAARSPVVGLIAPHREPHTPVLAALLRTARSVSEVEAAETER
jgi:DNA-binding transcriptional LysR family regulator